VTPSDVAAYQKRHLNHLGAPLLIDGVLGPQTQWAMDLDTLIAQRRAMVREAQCWLGLTEVPPGSNSDPGGVIQGWLTLCGAKPHDPWCASFLSHCIGASSVEVRIAGALNLGTHFPETRLPLVGDIFTYPTGGGKGHCGLITGVSAFELMTIEGNCANACRSVRRERGLSLPGPASKLRFWRVVPDTTGTCPGIPPNVPPAPGGVV
jgi:hypothetical protein